MFNRIDVECARDQITKKQLAEKADMKYDALLNKLKGKTEFTLSEMLRVQRAFKHRISLEDLFKSIEKIA